MKTTKGLNYLIFLLGFLGLGAIGGGGVLIVSPTGKQYFTTETPGFIWKGKTPLFAVIN